MHSLDDAGLGRTNGSAGMNGDGKVGGDYGLTVGRGGIRMLVAGMSSGAPYGGYGCPISGGP